MQNRNKKKRLWEEPDTSTIPWQEELWVSGLALARKDERGGSTRQEHTPGHWPSSAVLAAGCAVLLAQSSRAHPTRMAALWHLSAHSRAVPTASPTQPSRTNPSWFHHWPGDAFSAFSSCQLSVILACTTCPWSCSPLSLIPRGTGTCAWPAAVILIMLFSKDCLEENIYILAKRLQLGEQVQCVFRWGKTLKATEICFSKAARFSHLLRHIFVIVL